MVEASAHDLRGRRTPTRLSPDPFQTGRIGEKSTESAGAASGGGKLSGAGGEGLEGSVPAELKDELGRLATKQATLRNRAEHINMNYRASGFANLKLDEAIRLFRRTERDLADFHYRTVLRRKRIVLGTLSTARLAAAGLGRVRRDTTSPVPNRVLDDIADAMSSDLPPAYKNLLKRYYESLSRAAPQ